LGLLQIADHLLYIRHGIARRLGAEHGGQSMVELVGERQDPTVDRRSCRLELGYPCWGTMARWLFQLGANLFGKGADLILDLFRSRDKRS
jgi:hypothetical protein